MHKNKSLKLNSKLSQLLVILLHNSNNIFSIFITDMTEEGGIFIVDEILFIDKFYNFLITLKKLTFLIKKLLNPHFTSKF